MLETSLQPAQRLGNGLGVHLPSPGMGTHGCRAPSRGWNSAHMPVPTSPCWLQSQCLVIGDKALCPKGWCDPPAPTADPPVDTECVRAFKDGGESAELSTMSPASTSISELGSAHCHQLPTGGKFSGTHSWESKGVCPWQPMGAQLGGGQVQPLTI